MELDKISVKASASPKVEITAETCIADKNFPGVYISVNGILAVIVEHNKVSKAIKIHVYEENNEDGEPQTIIFKQYKQRTKK